MALQVKVVAGDSSVLTMDVPGDSGCRQCCINCKVPVMHTAFNDDGRSPTRVVCCRRLQSCRALRTLIDTAVE